MLEKLIPSVLQQQEQHKQENKEGQSPRKTKEGRILTTTGS